MDFKKKKMALPPMPAKAQGASRPSGGSPAKSPAPKQGSSTLPKPVSGPPGKMPALTTKSSAASLATPRLEHKGHRAGQASPSNPARPALPGRAHIGQSSEQLKKETADWSRWVQEHPAEAARIIQDWLGSESEE